MNISPTYRDLDQRKKNTTGATLVSAAAIVLIGILLTRCFSGCVTDAEGNTRFDTKTAVDAVNAGERIYSDYQRSTYPPPQSYTPPGYAPVP